MNTTTNLPIPKTHGLIIENNFFHSSIKSAGVDSGSHPLTARYTAHEKVTLCTQIEDGGGHMN